MNIEKIAIYDLHQWYGDRSFYLDIDDTRFEIKVLDFTNRSNEFDCYIFCDELIWTKLPFFVSKNKRIGLMKESPMHFEKLTAVDVSTVFNTILTHDIDFIKFGEPYVKLEYSSNWVCRDPGWPLVCEKSQMISFMGNVTRQTNSGYRFRRDVSDFILQRDDIRSFGIGINPVEFKTEALVPFRYSIVMENVKQDYYFSEKIIDCFLTKTIPIYWGCPSIGDIFDEGGIIHFNNINELNDILSSISRDDYILRLESVNSNFETCHRKGLDSFDSYLSRTFKKIDERGIGSGSKYGLGHSKIAAGIRYLCRL